VWYVGVFTAVGVYFFFAPVTQLADLLLWVKDIRQQLALRSDAKAAPGLGSDDSESCGRKADDDREDVRAESKGGPRGLSPAAAAIPYSIEPAQAAGSDLSASTSALLRIRFTIPAEL
jgi:hypothetical protein